MKLFGMALLLAAVAGSTPQPSAPSPPPPKTAEAPPAADDFAPPPPAKPAEPSKDALARQEMIDAALKKIDKEIKRDGNIWEFKLGERQIVVITDPVAERMRIMVPIARADALDKDMLLRLMQANFDSALDARYAVANDLLWGTFIHPLISLDEKGFVSGLAQAVAVAENFGTTYSSGAVVFGGGDSQGILTEEILDLLKKKAEADEKNLT